MPTSNKQQAAIVDQDKVSIIIAGKAHADWMTYQIDSDFLIPADQWSMTLGLPSGKFPADVKRGAAAQVKIGADTVMVGRIDNVQRSVARGQVMLSLSGRDSTAILVDCASPVLTARQVTLEEVIAQVVRPLGITNIRLQAESSIRNDKISVEPGERAWDTLMRACAGRGLWPWFAPDGTLIIGGPDYTTAPVATLIMRINGQGNNLLQLSDTSSIERSFSQLTVLGQGHAHTTKKSSLAIVDVDSPDAVMVEDDTDTDESQDTTVGTAETGFHGMKAVVSDPSISYYRPQVLVMHDADSQEQIQYRARKAMADARLAGYALNATVHGHRTSDKVLWAPGQRIHVISEPHEIDAIFFLMGREFNLSRSGGTTTTLRLKEDGVWIPDAFPKKKKKRNAKKKKADVRIVDVE
ncbi:phage baseplate assembly protein [Rahnella aquatilis]|uniref:phage baseplate assembly protein n=1 Tax=Rahnella aquatilis TaxID=34038 RepID=UPI0036649306